uniref:Uncharacterized protein n=1 Tax=Pyramimonas obovata TaxID=1411642 RepID=A0A7S0WU28_9CHLO
MALSCASMRSFCGPVSASQFAEVGTSAPGKSVLGNRRASFVSKGTPGQLTRGYRRARMSVRSALSLDRLPPTVATCTHPSTGCKVHLVGCLHGSPLSALDVATIIHQTQPSAVVLELCDKRFKSIKKALVEQEENITLGSDRTPEDTILKWRRGVRKAYIKRGLRHAIGAALISSLYLVQEVVSGFEPGTEFKSAIVASERMCGSTPELVNGDDDVTVTIRKLTTPSSFYEGLGPSELARQTTVMKRAFFGQEESGVSREVPQDVLPKFISVSDAIGHLWLDLVKTIVPIVVLVLPIANIIVEVIHAGDSVATGGTGVFVTAFNAGLCMVIPLFWLRIGDIVLSSRDEVLAASIMQTCQRHKGQTVVAVLGMLHCNGVIAKVAEDDCFK